jgi:hypothetical protein
MSEFHAPFPSSDLHGGSVVTGRQLSKAMGMHVLPFSELRIGPPCLSASNCGKAHARWLQVHDRLQVLHYQPCIGAAAEMEALEPWHHVMAETTMYAEYYIFQIYYVIIYIIFDFSNILKYFKQ